jgi:predicted GIY-YIG superfamily endonuclease
MSPPSRKKKWEFKSVAMIAKKFESRNEFRRNEGGAYSWARENNMLEVVCGHMKSLVRFDEESVRKIASACTTRSQFVEANPSAYKWALRKDFSEKVCAHMDIVRTKWSIVSVLKEAKKYSSRKEFSENVPGAYEHALRNKYLDQACGHMDCIGNRYKRALYAYEFDNGAVYIGLTFNYSRRDSEHRRRGRVFEELNHSNARWIKFDIWLEADQAAIEENALIEQYRADGWRILNKVKGGGLGGSVLTWTESELAKEAKQYNTLKEFRKNSSSAYAIAHQRGVIDFISSHLTRERNFWDLESVKAEAKKYATRSEFSAGTPGAADWARANSNFDDMCVHMEYSRNHWNSETVSNEAKKYKSRSEFKKHSGSAYMWAQRNGLLDDVCSHMLMPTKKSIWTIDNVNEIARKYSSKSEFKKHNSGAYQWARKNRLLDKVCNHMTKKHKNSKT